MSHDLATPSAWVARWSALIKPGDRVLDLACGHGRHARLLATQGAQVTALDRDETALASLQGVNGVTTLSADVESGPWPFEPASFDAVVVCNYLHRPLFPHIGAVLRDGGILIYQTFMQGNERYGKPSNPAFLLRPGELLEAFGSACQVVGFEQGLLGEPKPAVVQCLCAQKSAGEFRALHL
jgi:SAM-dependent methyltransferase